MTISDWITISLTGVTAIVAVATGTLAYFTYLVAKDASNTTRQAGQHHEQNLRPFCIIHFSGATKENPFGTDFDPQIRRLKLLMSKVEEIQTQKSIFIRGDLSNKGKGLATEIVIYLNGRLGVGEINDFRLTSPVAVSGLIGAEESIKIDVEISHRDGIQIWHGTEWRDVSLFESTPRETYEVVLEYKDVFGNVFRTIHSKGIFVDPSEAKTITEKSTQHKIMARPNRSLPIFLSGRQAVRTQSDFQ